MKISIIAISLIASFTSFSQDVSIPDAAFKSYLVGEPLININGDSEIQEAEALAFSGAINCSNLGITDLTGIEAFTNLVDLLCFNNSITSLDLSQNVNLLSITCANNSLSNLNVTGLTLLESLNCSGSYSLNHNLEGLNLSTNTSLKALTIIYSNLATLDVSSLVNLETLYCRDNQLTALDVSTSPNLEQLNCMENQLTNLNVTGLTNLTYISSGYNSNLNGLDLTTNTSLNDLYLSNSLTSLIDLSQNTVLERIELNNCNLSGTFDVSNFASLSSLGLSNNNLNQIIFDNSSPLTSLDIGNNQFSSIDLSSFPLITSLSILGNNFTSFDFSIFTNLESLQISGNPLINVDLSPNSSLTYLLASSCNLKTLNLANGNNTNAYYFNFNSNPCLTCIQIDPGFTPTSVWNKDNHASYNSSSCPIPAATPETTFAHTACGLYTWTNGVTYVADNNTAKDTLQNMYGCDSVIVTLNLTINNPTTGTDTQEACGSYTWIDGNNYTSSNNTTTYTLTGASATGCDSIVTLNLTINNPSSGTDTQEACGSYTWIDGNNYTSSNNTATYTLTGASATGCDSIVTLNLTINNPTTGTDTQEACGSYTWIDGNNYTNSNNTATYTLTGASATGCDSIVTLDLTIQSVSDISISVDGPVLTSNNTNATSYQWIDCDSNNEIDGATNATFTATQNGVYAVIVFENNCSDTSECTVVTSVGIDALSTPEINFNVFPNPNNGSFQLQTNETGASMQILSLDGKIIYTKVITSEDELISLDAEAGTYLMRLMYNNSIATKKLIIK